MSAHDEMIALAPAYAIGALDAVERRVFEEHLAICAICAAEVRSIGPVATGLAGAVPQVTPRRELRDRVLAAVGARDASADTGASRPVSTSRAPAAWLPYAAMLAIAAGLGVYAVRLNVRVSELEARLAEATTRLLVSDQEALQARRVALEAQNAMAVLAAPDLARIDLKGEAPATTAAGRALWSRQRGMVFTATNLPPLPAGRVYQVWVVTAAAPVSVGLLSPDDAGRGMAVFATPPDIVPVAVAVTNEPAGGVAAPTSQPLLVGTPAPQI